MRLVIGVAPRPAKEKLRNRPAVLRYRGRRPSMYIARLRTTWCGWIGGARSNSSAMRWKPGGGADRRRADFELLFPPLSYSRARNGEGQFVGGPRTFSGFETGGITDGLPDSTGAERAASVGRALARRACRSSRYCMRGSPYRDPDRRRRAAVATEGRVGSNWAVAAKDQVCSNRAVEGLVGSNWAVAAEGRVRTHIPVRELNSGRSSSRAKRAIQAEASGAFGPPEAFEIIPGGPKIDSPAIDFGPTVTADLYAAQYRDILTDRTRSF